MNLLSRNSPALHHKARYQTCKTRIVPGCLITLSILLTSHPVMAKTMMMGKPIPMPTVRIPPVITLVAHQPEIAIDSSVNIGGPISKPLLLSMPITLPNHRVNTPNAYATLNGGAINTGNSPMPTGLEGIGYQLWWRQPDGGLYPLSNVLPLSALTGNSTFVLQFFRTQEKMSGGFLPPQSISLQTEDGLMTSLRLPANIRFKMPTCKVYVPKIISLGTHTKSEFKNGLGSTSSATNFAIDMRCPGGYQTIQYRMDSLNTTPQQDPSVSGLLPDSNVRGIGVQILDGEKKPFTLNQNTLLSDYNRLTGMRWRLPFSARYIQTESKIIGSGSADSALKFIITYN